jgi:hypothetical protein
MVIRLIITKQIALYVLMGTINGLIASISYTEMTEMDRKCVFYYRRKEILNLSNSLSMIISLSYILFSIESTQHRYLPISQLKLSYGM